MGDPRSTGKAVYNKSIDAQASVLLPHMDNDLNILYLAGKGDNSLSYYELRNDEKICHYLSLYRDGIPQKSGGDVFQEDIFPQCASSKPGLSAEEWTAGNNADPKTMSMDPDDRKDEDANGDVTFTKRKTYDEVVAENMELLKKVKTLEDEVASLKAQLGGADEEEEVKEEATEMDVEQPAENE